MRGNLSSCDGFVGVIILMTPDGTAASERYTEKR
jgi:hypothetical protein